MAGILRHYEVHFTVGFRSWFDQLSLGAFSGGVLEILAANPSQMKHLRENCLAGLTQAAQSVTGRLVTVTLSLNPSASSETFQTKPEFESVDTADKTLTFETFVDGACNRLALAATQAVVDSPGSAYNPLFIYGASGLGKTHLAAAIQSGLQHRGCDSIAFVSAAKFVSQVVELWERPDQTAGNTLWFDTEAFILDDVHRLSGRERSQEALFHVLSTRIGSGRQVVLTSDRVPSALVGFEARLVSRFESGLCVPLEPPCRETRLDILRKKSGEFCIPAPDEVLEFLAANVEADPRRLIDALRAVDEIAHRASSPISIALAKDALRSVISGGFAVA